MLMYISFKAQVDADHNRVAAVLSSLGYIPSKQRMNTPSFGNLPGSRVVLSRSSGNHVIQVELRERMSSQDRSYYWIRWFNVEGGSADPEGLVRLMNDLVFTLRMHFAFCVNWMQTAVKSTHSIQPFGFQENVSKIWTKKDKELLFTYYPVYDYNLFEVRNKDIKKPIDPHQFVYWIEELQHNLLGQSRPNDQIKLNLVV